MFPSLTRETGWPRGTCRTPPELSEGSQTLSEPGEAGGSRGAAGICCSLFQGTGDVTPK